MAMAIKWLLDMPAWTLKNSINNFGKPIVFLLALSPFIRLIWFGWIGSLTANPIEFITRFTGTWAIVMLCLTLAITPLRITTGWNSLQKYRRMLGLFCSLFLLSGQFTSSIGRLLDLLMGIKGLEIRLETQSICFLLHIPKCRFIMGSSARFCLAQVIQLLEFGLVSCLRNSTGSGCLV
jgi:hypothetical protein